MQKIEPQNQIEVAKKIVEYAKELGFAGASVTLLDDQNEPHETIESLADAYTAGDVVPVILIVHLSEDIEIEIVEDEETEERTIKYI